MQCFFNFALLFAYLRDYSIEKVFPFRDFSSRSSPVTLIEYTLAPLYRKISLTPFSETNKNLRTKFFYDQL